MKRKIILVILVLLILLPGGYYLVNKDKPMAEEKYLKKYSTNLNLDDVNDFSGLELINEELKDKEIIFTNEEHGAKENSFLNWKFLMYLVKNHGVNYLIIENSYADSQMLNEYLSTGDEKFLQDFFQVWSSKTATKEAFEMYKQLYQYNKDVPEEKKVKVIGIDLDYNRLGDIDYLKKLLSNVQTLPEEFGYLNESLNKLEETSVNLMNGKSEKENFAAIVEVTTSIEKDIEKNKELYEEAFKDKFFDFSHIIKNIKDTTIIPKPHLDLVDYYNKRDKVMYENFKKIYNHLPKGKYYGQFGKQHVFQEETGGIKFLAYHLSKGELFKDKVYSIHSLYTEGVIWGNGVISFEKQQFKSVRNELNKVLEGAYGDYKVKLINLEKKKSPFENNLDLKYFDEADVLEKQGVLTDYFQSVIIIDKPTPSNPYDEKLMGN